jgi:hypothetical protein
VQVKINYPSSKTQIVSFMKVPLLTTFALALAGAVLLQTTSLAWASVGVGASGGSEYVVTNPPQKVSYPFVTSSTDFDEFTKFTSWSAGPGSGYAAADFRSGASAVSSYAGPEAGYGVNPNGAGCCFDWAGGGADAVAGYDGGVGLVGPVEVNSPIIVKLGFHIKAFLNTGSGSHFLYTQPPNLGLIGLEDAPSYLNIVVKPSSGVNEPVPGSLQSLELELSRHLNEVPINIDQDYELAFYVGPGSQFVYELQVLLNSQAANGGSALAKITNMHMVLPDGFSVNSGSGVFLSQPNTTFPTLTPSVLWASPAPIRDGTPLTIAQLNATASTPGTLTYSPPLGTILERGAGQNIHTL